MNEGYTLFNVTLKDSSSAIGEGLSIFQSQDNLIVTGVVNLNSPSFSGIFSLKIS